MGKLLLVIVIFLGANIFAQNSTKEIDTVIYTGNQKTIKYTDGSQYVTLEKSNANKIPNATPSKRVFNSDEEEIHFLETYIASLEKKKNHVQSDAAEDKLAKEKGWYIEIDKYLQESKNRLNELQNQNNLKK